jgi:HK97 family phage portal protein
MPDFFRTVWSWISGSTFRNAGTQISGPLGYAQPSAVEVSEDTAMQVSAVWACVRLLSETVASLPVHVYEKTPNGRVDAPDHWFNQLMQGKVNQYQTRVEFFETMMLNLVLHGNCYARITRLGGQVRSLMPLMAGQMETRLLPDGSVVHLYTDGANIDVLSSESVWHVKLYGNGIIGKSPLAYARNIVGIAQATETAVSKIYQNGGKPSGTLSTDRLLTPEQRDIVRQNFSTLTTGSDDRLLVLESGMEFKQVSLSPQDIELLASRRFQMEEIARWFGVPSVLINDTSASSAWGSGIEQLVSGFYKLNLRPYLERFEASIDVNLLGAERKKYHFEFDFEGLLRSDLKTRLEGYRTAVAGTILTPNEVRRMEGWAEVEGGDVLLSQVNMTPITSLGKGLENETQAT